MGLHSPTSVGGILPIRSESRAVHKKKISLAGAPALLIGKGPPYRGTVLLYHGLSSSKETQEKELEQLAGRDFLAVGIDAVGHGDRRYADFEQRMDSDRWYLEMLGMVQETAREVPSVIAHLRELSGELGEVALTGISMGACIVYSALAHQDLPVKAAVPILGSPDWSMGGRRPLPEKWRARSPHLRPERMAPLPMLIQNAGKDQHVSPEPAREFAAQLRPHYQSCPHRLEYVEYPESDHFMRPQDWETMWDRTMHWCAHYL